MARCFRPQWAHWVTILLLALCRQAAADPEATTPELIVQIDEQPIVLVFPAADEARTLSLRAVGENRGTLSVSAFDPNGFGQGEPQAVQDHLSMPIARDGPRQVVLRADRPTNVTFTVSGGPWALQFPFGRAVLATLTGEHHFYFPKDVTAGLDPWTRIRLAGTGDDSRLSRCELRWGSFRSLKLGPFTGAFDHAVSVNCYGGEDLIRASLDCRRSIIQFPDRPFAILSGSDHAIVKALETMPNVLSPAKNLLWNGSFEDDVDNDGLPDGGWWRWSPLGPKSLTLTDRLAHSGQRSITCGLPSDGGAWVSTSPAIAAGDRIRLTFWAHAEGLDRPALAVMASRDRNRMNMGKLSHLRTIVEIPKDTNGWRRFQTELTMPQGAHYVFCQFRHASKQGALHIDDVEMTRLGKVSAKLSPRTPPPGVGKNQLLVRVGSQSGAPAGLQVQTVSPDGTEQKASAVVSPAGGEVDVPITVVYPKPGRQKVQVKVVDPKTQEVMRTFETDVTLPALFYHRIVEPSYVCLEDGLKEVTTEITLHASAEIRADLQLGARLLDEAGEELWKDLRREPPERDTVLRIPIEGLGVGRYDVEVTLSGPALDKPQTRKMDFHIVNRGEAVVTIDENQKLVAGGKPFFPIGIWPFDGNIARTARETGANCILSWSWSATDEPDGRGTRLDWAKWVLDEAHKHGLKWMVGLGRAETHARRFKTVRRRARALGNHPGLLVWEEDEQIAHGGPNTYDAIKTIYGLLREEDPHHPFVTGDVMTRPGLKEGDLPMQGTGSFQNIVFPPGAHDIGMWWWYPLPLPEDAQGFGGPEGREYLTGGLRIAGDKPLWITLQVFAWGPDRSGLQGDHIPTIDEIKCMTYLAIAWGVDGVWYYGVVGQSYTSLDSDPQKYQQFKDFTKDLRRLEPALCAADERRFKATPDDFAVDSVMKTHAGRKYLIAANRNKQPRQATFQIEGLADKAITVYQEDRTIQAAGGTFTDAFDGFGTHVYIWNR